MKKIFLSLLIIAFAVNVYSQITVQGTIKRGSTPRTVDIYAKPSASFSQKDEAMLFALAIPATVLPAPSLGSSGVTQNSTGLISGISGIQPSVLLNNFGATQREVITSLENINGKPHYLY